MCAVLVVLGFRVLSFGCGVSGCRVQTADFLNSFGPKSFTLDSWNHNDLWIVYLQNSGPHVGLLFGNGAQRLG